MNDNICKGLGEPGFIFAADFAFSTNSHYNGEKFLKRRNNLIISLDSDDANVTKREREREREAKRNEWM